jgi:hypothetical protein
LYNVLPIINNTTKIQKIQKQNVDSHILHFILIPVPPQLSAGKELHDGLPRAAKRLDCYSFCSFASSCENDDEQKKIAAAAADPPYLNLARETKHHRAA